ncbi:MAG: hypothetical protein Q8908_16820, partial [Bacteroidota bacterium]|nr:hypothetical protein [Bacteroidota bacterium]
MIVSFKKIFSSNYVRIAAFVAFAIITAILLYSRYLNMGIEPGAVTRFIAVWFIACLILLGATYYFKNALNPINFYVIFILCYGFNFLKLSADSTDLSPATHLVLILSIVFFILGIILGNKLKTEPRVLMNRQSKATIFYATYVCIVLTFILEVRTFGYLPLFKIFSVDVYKETNEKLVSFLHYF